MESYTPEQVKELILELLSKIAPEIEPREIQPDESLRDQVDIDSIDFINFITMIHQRLGVDIPESDYGRLTTLENMISYLLGRLAKPVSPP